MCLLRPVANKIVRYSSTVLNIDLERSEVIIEVVFICGTGMCTQFGVNSNID